MDIVLSIRQRYDGLSRTQRHIADYVLEHMHEVCFDTLRGLSEKVGASEATVLSFCAKLPCKNFLGLKQELRSYTSGWIAPNQKLKRSVGEFDTGDSAISMLMEAERNCLNRTFDMLTPQALRKFVALLDQSEQIYIVGHGVSAQAAIHLQYRLRQVGCRVNHLDILDRSAVVHQVSTAGARDLFVLISFPNYAPQTVALAEFLFQSSARVACITDTPYSPIARGAKAVLLCNTDNIIFCNSMATPIVLVNLLSSLLALERRETLSTHVDRLEQIESFLWKKEMELSAKREYLSEFPTL